MSGPLESGYYTFNSLLFRSPEDVKSFPLGPSTPGPHPIEPVVVLSLGDRPPVWRLEKLPNGNYNIFQDGKYAKPQGADVFLSSDNGIPTEWKIIRGAPSPPPIGRDNFGIILAHDDGPQKSWSIESHNPKEPVHLRPSASSIHIVQLYD